MKKIELVKGFGVFLRGSCHEVYLNDPRRTDPGKLRTIVRWPISLARPKHARGRA